MINPFERIVAPDLGEPEELGGTYECETCFKVIHEALYFEKERLVIWTCPDGHKNSVEGVKLD